MLRLLFGFYIGSVLSLGALAEKESIRAKRIDQAQMLINHIPHVDLELFPQATDQHFGQITGTIYRYSDFELLQELVRRNQGALLDKTERSSELLDQLERSLKKNAKDLGLQLRILRRGQIFYLKGKGAKKALRNLRLIDFKLKLIPSKNKKPKTPSRVIQPTIFLELAFIEVKKTALRRLGLRFGDRISFNSIVQPKVISAPIKIENFNPIGSFLEAALKRNLARVHFKQSLLSENLKEAFFRVGGEYSYRNNTRHISSVAKIPYGINLRFRPKLHNKNKLHLNLYAKIREPDLTSGVGDFPEVKEKILNTELNVTLGETFAIAGILKKAQGRGSARLPGIGEIPVLGRIFSSKNFRSRKSEAYIFITPRRLKEKWNPKPMKDF